MSRTLSVLVLALLVALAGCGGVGGGDAGSGDGGDAGDGGQAPPDGDTVGDDERTVLASQERLRVRTGEADVEVASFGTARENLSATARDLGGYVAGSDRRTHREGNRTWTTGRLVLRVPSENFTVAMDRVGAVGTVTRSSTNVTDVTDRLVDLDARLENLREKRDRLRGLYEAANDTEELLAIGERLSETQGEIERLEAERAALADQVAYSTVRVSLAEPEPARPDREPDATAWHETGLVSAFATSVAGVATTARALAVAVAYVLPYALAFGGPLVGGYYLHRRWRERYSGS